MLWDVNLATVLAVASVLMTFGVVMSCLALVLATKPRQRSPQVTEAFGAWVSRQAQTVPSAAHTQAGSDTDHELAVEVLERAVAAFAAPAAPSRHQPVRC
jgi:hypothetical protein